MMNKILTNKFFSRPTTLIAKELLGKLLVYKVRGKIIKVMITEVEAYDGFHDKASHAHRGITKRNWPMFGDAGFWYVYLCYGMYNMLNIVTGPKGYPAAILIRGGIVESGKKLNGPGKLSKYLKINKNFNAKKSDKKSGLWIAEISSGEQIKFLKKFNALSYVVSSGPRIGVHYAGPIWAKKRYRYWLEFK